MVTPFRAHANRMRDMAYQVVDAAYLDRARVDIETVHVFQGDERDVILFSPCIARDIPDAARRFLARTWNLFNVALTRARTLLHVVGDREACLASEVPHISEFAHYVASLNEPGVPGACQPKGGAESRVGYWEKPLYDALRRAGLKPIPQYAEGQYRLDLAIIDENLKLDIEVDGDLHHREWDGSRCRTDVLRDLRLIGLGWTVKRFWAYRVRDDIAACVREVVDIVRRAEDLSGQATEAII